MVRMLGTTNFGRYLGCLLTPGLSNGSILKANLHTPRLAASYFGRIVSTIEEESIERYCCHKKWIINLDSYV